MKNARAVAKTMGEQYVELIKNVFDRWERQVTGSPTWDDIDELMIAIFRAINPERQP